MLLSGVHGTGGHNAWALSANSPTSGSESSATQADITPSPNSNAASAARTANLPGGTVIQRSSCYCSHTSHFSLPVSVSGSVTGSVAVTGSVTVTVTGAASVSVSVTVQAEPTRSALKGVVSPHLEVCP